MERHNLMALGVLALMFLSSSAMGEYNATYTVSDLDDIVIDVTATAMVEVKGDVPDIVDIGVLYLLIILLGGVLVALVGIVTIPKMLMPKHKVKNLKRV